MSNVCVGLGLLGRWAQPAMQLQGQWILKCDLQVSDQERWQGPPFNSSASGLVKGQSGLLRECDWGSGLSGGSLWRRGMLSFLDF